MHVAEPIHPDSAARPAGSRAEARAAQWGAARLSSSGYEVAIDTFPARTSIASPVALDMGVCALAATLLGIAPLVALVLGLIAVVVYARDTEGRSLFARRTAMSQNVVGMNGASPRVVVFAAMAGYQGWSEWRSSLGTRFRSLTLALHFVLIAVPVVAGAAWVFGVHDMARFEGLGVVLAAVLVGAGWWLVRHDEGRSVAARDIPLEVALRIAQLRLPNVWVVLGGASGAGNEGMQALLRKRGDAIGDAWVLNLEQAGDGEVVAVEHEGVLKPRRAFGGLVQAAEDAGAVVRDWRDTPTDGGVALAHHFKAMTLLLTPGDMSNAADRMFAIVRSIVVDPRGRR